MVKKKESHLLCNNKVLHKTSLNDLNLTSDHSSFEEAAKDRGSFFREI